MAGNGTHGPEEYSDGFGGCIGRRPVRFRSWASGVLGMGAGRVWCQVFRFLVCFSDTEEDVAGFVVSGVDYLGLCSGFEMLA